MAQRGKKKIKDLVDMLENPDELAYVGADYDEYEELLETEDEEELEEEEE